MLKSNTPNGGRVSRPSRVDHKDGHRREVPQGVSAKSGPRSAFTKAVAQLWVPPREVPKDCSKDGPLCRSRRWSPGWFTGEVRHGRIPSTVPQRGSPKSGPTGWFTPGVHRGIAQRASPNGRTPGWSSGVWPAVFQVMSQRRDTQRGSSKGAPTEVPKCGSPKDPPKGGLQGCKKYGSYRLDLSRGPKGVLTWRSFPKALPQGECQKGITQRGSSRGVPPSIPPKRILQVISIKKSSPTRVPQGVPQGCPTVLCHRGSQVASQLLFPKGTS
jgi:hypothetical protein